MELIEIVKKRLEAKGWDFASDYFDDEELASLHEVILETEAALRQPPVIGRSELLLAFGKFIDSDCDLLGSDYIEEMVKKFEASNSH